MAKKHKHPEHENLERWLVSYADFITLLFATFVVLYALAQVDAVDFAKQKKYYSLSYEFMKKWNMQNYQHRFDIVEVYGGKDINHIKNAF